MSGGDVYQRGDTYKPIPPEPPSLRDQFAMAALSRLATLDNFPQTEETAVICYAYADMMLKVRARLGHPA
jgi:hypothetical protein